MKKLSIVIGFVETEIKCYCFLLLLILFRGKLLQKICEILLSSGKNNILIQ